MKSKEYKSLISKMDKVSDKLQHVVKISDLDNILTDIETNCKAVMEHCVNSAASELHVSDTN